MKRRVKAPKTVAEVIDGAPKKLDQPTLNTMTDLVRAFVDAEAPSVETRLYDLRAGLLIVSAACQSHEGSEFNRDTLAAMSDKLMDAANEVLSLVGLLPFEALQLKYKPSEGAR